MIADDLAEIGRSLGARAAGFWSVTDGELRQVAFWSAPDMPREVADGFASATQTVRLSEIGLGIVRALLDDRPFVSVAEELPPESGSGLWLRRFGATRSIAVPVKEGGTAVGVISVAVPDGGLTQGQVVSRLESGDWSGS